MKETIAGFVRKPWIAHLVAAVERFLNRLGPQFAGSVTYFSILSMVPVLLFGIAVLGFVVTVFRPDLLTDVQNILQEQLGAATIADSVDADEKTQSLADSISTFITETFNSWRGVGTTALVVAAYSGSRWVKNLKHAVRAMWKDSFAEAARKGPFLKELLGNLIIFFGLLVSIAVAVAVTAAGQAFPEDIIGWLGLQGVPGINLLLQLVSLTVSFVASWLLFAFLFVVLPGERTRPATFLKATIAGAVLVTALQQLAGVLLSALGSNNSISVIGPIIIVMIVFNVLAMIILMISAWVGTADSWEAERTKRKAYEAAGIEPEDETGIDATEVENHRELTASRTALSERRRSERWAAHRDPDSLRTINFDPSTVNLEDSDATVKQGVAARSVSVGMGLGYGVGAATGVGVGAIAAAIVGKFSRR